MNDLQLHDARGRRIHLGDAVVYNLGGGLALGVVRKITRRSPPYWAPEQPRYTIHIVMRNEGDSLAEIVSQVKNSDGVIVLDEFPD
jgi:hypothetical protein